MEKNEVSAIKETIKRHVSLQSDAIVSFFLPCFIPGIMRRKLSYEKRKNRVDRRWRDL